MNVREQQLIETAYEAARTVRRRLGEVAEREPWLCDTSDDDYSSDFIDSYAQVKEVLANLGTVLNVNYHEDDGDYDELFEASNSGTFLEPGLADDEVERNPQDSSWGIDGRI